MKKSPSAAADISDPKNATAVSAQGAGETFAYGRPRSRVLALDLEATLISSAVSQFPRPYLFEFLVRCRELFPRIVMFTTIKEERFRRVAKTLVEEGLAPAWFEQLEYVNWTGPTKDLRFIPGCTIADALLVDDLEEYIHPDQRMQWVRVEPFEPPFNDSGRGLATVIEELEERVRPSAHPGV